MSEPVTFSGMAKFQICKRLGSNWHDLADVLEIPLYERGFTPGREPQGVWEWLEQREGLAILPEKLIEIGRPELAKRLGAERAMRPAEDQPAEPIVTAFARNDLLAELSALDLEPTDWCLLASRVATVREHLAAYAEESANDGSSAALAVELDEVLGHLATEPAGVDDWRVAREVRDALRDRLAAAWRPD